MLFRAYNADDGSLIHECDAPNSGAAAHETARACGYADVAELLAVARVEVFKVICDDYPRVNRAL